MLDYEKIKQYYLSGVWSEKMVLNAVGKIITEKQAQEILGSI